MLWRWMNAWSAEFELLPSPEQRDREHTGAFQHVDTPEKNVAACFLEVP